MQMERQLGNLKSEMEELHYKLRNVTGSMFVVMVGIAVLLILFKI